MTTSKFLSPEEQKKVSEYIEKIGGGISYAGIENLNKKIHDAGETAVSEAEKANTAWQTLGNVEGISQDTINRYKEAAKINSQIADISKQNDSLELEFNLRLAAINKEKLSDEERNAKVAALMAEIYPKIEENNKINVLMIILR